MGGYTKDTICSEYDLDESTMNQLCIVFMYVQNGNLGSRISCTLSVPPAFISLCSH
jgi:hypothetical protein